MGRNHQSRRGSVYLVVLATVAVVTTLALTGLALVRVQRRTSQTAVDMMDARTLAVSAMNQGAAIMDQTSWRAASASASGVLLIQTTSKGTIRVDLADPVDSDLANNDEQVIQLLGTGSAGSAVQKYRVDMRPVFLPMSCLQVGIASGNDLGVAGVITGKGKVTSNTKIDANSARIYVPVEATGAVSGSAYYSTQASSQPARQVPADEALAWYKTNGTQIPLAAVPSARLQNAVLSAGSNPYGATNSRGIYWLDCNSNNFELVNVRVVGTLVLFKAGDVRVSGGVNWEPAEVGMPALLVQGKLRMETTMAPLSEGAVGVNFNPVSTPYKGSSNATKTDAYPSVVTGLVFSTDDLEVLGELTLVGVLVCSKKVDVTGILGLIYDNTSYYNPPPGFRASSYMATVPGTYVQVVN